MAAHSLVSADAARVMGDRSHLCEVLNKIAKECDVCTVQLPIASIETVNALLRRWSF